MEHIVQFGIGIDDETIRKRIEESAYNDICDRFYKEALSRMPSKYLYYGQKPSKNEHVDWKKLIDGYVIKILSDSKQEIIELAAEKLVQSYSRTKAYKETMAEIDKKVISDEK